jgi:transposase
MRAKAKRFNADFKAEAVELAKRDNRSFAELASDLGISSWTLRNWYKQDEMAKKPKAAKKAALPSAATKNETAEQRAARLERDNARLRKENDQLRMDREILKKAAAFFAKESE